MVGISQDDMGHWPLIPIVCTSTFSNGREHQVGNNAHVGRIEVMRIIHFSQYSSGTLNKILFIFLPKGPSRRKVRNHRTSMAVCIRFVTGTCRIDIAAVVTQKK